MSSKEVLLIYINFNSFTSYLSTIYILSIFSYSSHGTYAFKDSFRGPMTFISILMTTEVIKRARVCITLRLSDRKIFYIGVNVMGFKLRWPLIRRLLTHISMLLKSILNACLTFVTVLHRNINTKLHVVWEVKSKVLSFAPQAVFTFNDYVSIPLRLISF